MTKKCQNCQRYLKDGDKVSFYGMGTFHLIDSEVHFALSDTGMVIDPDSIVHADQEDCGGYVD